MDSKKLAKLYASTRALSLFSYQDRSSEEIIKINRRLGITTENWQSVKQQFIEERYSRRLHEAWSRVEWARQELSYLESIDFSESQDRQVLKERYTKELSKIVKGRMKSNEQPTSFKWIGNQSQLRELFDSLNGKYINATWNEFNQLFEEKEVRKIKPLQWMESDWQLYLLIDELSNHLKIIEYNEINLKIQSCFINKNGAPFKIDSIKSQKSAAKVSMGGSPLKERKLRDIIEKVKYLKEQ